MSEKQNVLIIGGGGREHALAWKIAQSPMLGRLYVAPGNAGTAAIATNVPIPVTDIPAIVGFAKQNRIGLTVVGPDDALAAGIVDAFTAEGLRIYGPTRAAAQIEASKAFSKDLMVRHNIPTAAYQTFTGLASAQAYVRSQNYPLVVKASGLALGKGVYICATVDEALHALDDIMTGKIFGAAGRTVIIEEHLAGQEVSIHAFCDGRTARLFPSAQDHKRIGTGDTGPNTGGMGAFAPVPWVEPALMEQARANVVEPALSGLSQAGAPFAGTLYPGLMVSDAGNIKVLEFNARFGDPETQPFMCLLQSDLLEILNACTLGALANIPIEWSGQTAVTVVLASAGYPGKIVTGHPISGLEEAASQPGVVVFHAGTRQQDGQIVTSGGRVLGVTATGTGLREARRKAYAAIKHIHFEGMQFRTDIGSKALPGA